MKSAGSSTEKAVFVDGGDKKGISSTKWDVLVDGKGEARDKGSETAPAAWHTARRGQ